MYKQLFISTLCAALLLLATGCPEALHARQRPLNQMQVPEWVQHAFSVAAQQSEKMYETVESTSRLPRSIQKGMVAPADWTAGFFPGTLWYLYAYTGEEVWRRRAETATALLEGEQFNAFDHDIGFKMYCSYGNGLQLTGNPAYEQIIFRSAKTLSSRYCYKTGLIMSWEPDQSRDWQFPVIIDNMMNLELMMEAYKMSGDTTLRHIAVSHADKTMKCQYRENMSCPHVVDYDAETGAVRKFDWNNGSDDVSLSTWARGQSWGLYGFTMMYRQTGDETYLSHAERIADFLLSHPGMPADMIPYWDYTGPERSTMRDASAAAIMASALMELSCYSANGRKYFDAGEKQLKSLASPAYLAKPGTHKNFILMHATGNYLRNSELDAALSYADYYFTEGLLRYIRLTNGQDIMSRFKDTKFGLFIHWGLYAQTAGTWKGRSIRGGEHIMLQARIPLKEYAAIADEFNPVFFDAEKWVKTAKQAGMKYIVYTTKHHDGFAMYHSACSDYNIVERTAFGRDPLKELAAACKKEGIKLGLYYSLGRDWEDPDVPTVWPVKGGRSNTWDYPDEDNKQLPAYIERKVKPQLRELLTNYGEIAFLWFDTPELVTRQQSRELRRLIRSLQPECFVNDRIGNEQGDYSIMEQKLSDNINRRPWEACLTMGKNWGYNRNDTLYRRPDIIIRNLTDIISKGGNLLLNVGPDQLGRFPKQTENIVQELHKWLNRNGEAIYGTSPWRLFGETLSAENEQEKIEQKPFHDAVYDGTPQNIVPDVRYTAKGKNVYVVIRHVAATAYTLRSFMPDTDHIRKVTCLGSNRSINWQLTEKGLHIKDIRCPEAVYVLKIECD